MQPILSKQNQKLRILSSPIALLQLQHINLHLPALENIIAIRLQGDTYT